MKQNKKLSILFSLTLDIEGQDVPDGLYEALREGHLTMDDLDACEVSAEKAAAFQWAMDRLQEAEDISSRMSWKLVLEPDSVLERMDRLP